MINELVNHTKRKTSTLLDKVNNLVQDMIHEIEDKPLPKELPLKLPKLFAFKSTQPPRNPQLNINELSGYVQESCKESMPSATVDNKSYMNEASRSTDEFSFQCVLCIQLFLQKKELIKHFQSQDEDL